MLNLCGNHSNNITVVTVLGNGQISAQRLLQVRTALENGGCQFLLLGVAVRPFLQEPGNLVWIRSVWKVVEALEQSEELIAALRSYILANYDRITSEEAREQKGHRGLQMLEEDLDDCSPCSMLSGTVRWGMLAEDVALPALTLWTALSGQRSALSSAATRRFHKLASGRSWFLHWLFRRSCLWVHLARLVPPCLRCHEVPGGCRRRT